MGDITAENIDLRKIFCHYDDFPSLIKEVTCEMTGEAVYERIEREASISNVEISTAAKCVISSQIKHVSKLVENREPFERDLEGTLSILKYLLKREALISTDIGEQLISDASFLSLPLMALWKFKCTGVVSLEQILKSIHDKRGSSLEDILDELTQIILHRGHLSDSSSVVSDALGALVNFSCNLDENKYHSLSMTARSLLDAITERLLDYVMDKVNNDNCEKKANQISDDKANDGSTQNAMTVKGEDTTLNIYELLMNNLRVSTKALQTYCSSQLTAMLTHRPDLHVAKVLKSQEKWRSTLVNPLLSSLMTKLIIVIGYEAALQSLNDVVTNEEVNWGCVLTLVAISINCHKLVVPLLKSIIEQHILSGCRDQDMEALVIGFIFARHSSQEGRHLFPSYSQWFSSLFATESVSPAANKQGFVFLIKFLTDLVPHEPPYCLRAHLTSHIFVPKGCQDLLRDYFNLARVRLQELKDDLECNIGQRKSVQEQDKLIQEVESCIEQFSLTGKVPNFVLEASIFRKPYFRTSFLPTLLAPRTLPDEPDAKGKLIDILHSSSKIPSSMYKSYVEECEKITSDLLSGVFINVEEEIVIEEPITELKHILNELLDSSASVLPTLSRISHKIEELMRAPDLKMKDKKHLILNPRLYNSKLVSYQVIEAFENTLKKVFFSQKPGSDETRLDWVSQFVSLLSSSITLQSSLFNHLLYNLEYGHHQDLPEDDIRIQGLMLTEITKIEGLFLPVVNSSAMNAKPVNFVSFFIDRLDMNLTTKCACVHTCNLISHWLKLCINFNSFDEDSLSAVPVKLINLYCFLAPRISLMQSEEDQEEMTMAHVSNYLGGRDVPDCAKLYFDKLKKFVQKNDWMPIDKWVLYELRAPWEVTPVPVRLAYLECKIKQDYLSCNALHKSSLSNDALGEILLKIIVTLLKAGAKENNSREVIMLLQRLAILHPDANICLLEEWQSMMKQQLMDSRKASLFMILCHYLPPPYFLPSKRLIQLSGALKQLVTFLKTLDQGLHLNLGDTSFLVSCLFHAAKDPSVKDIQIHTCLQHITAAIIFHWESLERIFGDNAHVFSRFNCLVNLHSILKDPTRNFGKLSGDEGGVALLMMYLRESSLVEESHFTIPMEMKGHFLKWSLAYLGLQQLHCLIPFFPRKGDILEDLREKDRLLISLCKRELEEYLSVCDLPSFVEKIFPVSGEKSLCLRMVPTSCVFVSLLELSKARFQNLKTSRSKFEVQLFEILLKCHTYMGQVFDKQESIENQNLPAESLGKSTTKSGVHKHVVYANDVEYISDLYRIIFSILQKIPPRALSCVTKSTIANCDGELKSALEAKFF